MKRASRRNDSPTPSAESEEEAEHSPAESEEESSESDGEPIILLQSGREKRTNAGNRMRDLLDLEEALVVEEDFKEEVGDGEFVGKDEADIFDSDFGSTDEGSAPEDDLDGEKRLEREAKLERRAARGSKKSKIHTPFLPNFARQTKGALKQKAAIASSSKHTLDDDAEKPAKRPRVKRSIESIIPRESSRKSAVAFKETIQGRLKESAIKRATTTRPRRKAAVSLTQADLIAEALETEEINRASLLAFYAAEEDRREADRLYGMRYMIIGPKVTLLSRTEGGGTNRKGKGKEVEEEPEPTEEELRKTEKDRLESGRRRLIQVIGESGKEGWRAELDIAAAATAGAAERGGEEIRAAPTLTNGTGRPSRASTRHAPPSSVSKLLNDDAPASTSVAFFPNDTPTTALSPQLPDLPPLPLVKVSTNGTAAEQYTRNYVIVSEFDGETDLSEEFRGIFGPRHQYGAVEVIPDEERTPTRKIAVCPITGLPARYRDPRTRTPYATIEAYNILTKMVAQDYVWNEAAGAYTGHAGLGVQRGIELESGKRKRPPPVVAGPSAAPIVVSTPTPIGPGAAARAIRAKAKMEEDVEMLPIDSPLPSPALSHSASPAPNSSQPKSHARSKGKAKAKARPRATPRASQSATPATSQSPAPTPAPTTNGHANGNGNENGVEGYGNGEIKLMFGSAPPPHAGPFSMQ